MTENNISDLLSLRKSKARRALLALFFANPEQEYFPRQLERLTGVLVGNLQRELVRMERAGLLSSRRLGRLKLYALNRKNPLHAELAGIVKKTVGLEDLVRGRLAGLAGVEAACIYGSFARGEERPDSDVDLLVIGAVDEKPLIHAVKSLEQQLQREINYSLYTKDEWAKRRGARDPFVLEVLKQPKLSLIGDIDAL